MVEIDFQELMEKAREMGSQEIEFFCEDSRSNDLKVYQGEVESLVSSQSCGVGIRAFRDHRMGFSYTSDFSREGLLKALKLALDNARVAEQNELKALPHKADQYPELDFYNPQLEKEEVERKIELLLELEKKALQYDSRIRSAPEVIYRDGTNRIMLVNSRGLELEFKRNLCYALIYVLAEEEGDVQTGLSLTHGRSLEELNIEETAAEASQEALVLLGASQIPSQEAVVVFKPEIGARFLSLIGDALTAEAVQKKRSLFAGKMGEEVASSQVELIDDGLLEKGLASMPFDGEGVPSTRTEVISSGRLNTYLYDTYTARKEGKESTGNAVRSSYKSFPQLSTTNLYLGPGDCSSEELIGNLDYGFYVMDVSGLHSGANPISGDFSVGASGRMIRDGSFQESVREVTIAGNFIDFLKNIDVIADDLTFNPLAGACGSPTFLVSSLAISGS